MVFDTKDELSILFIGLRPAKVSDIIKALGVLNSLVCVSIMYSIMTARFDDMHVIIAPVLFSTKTR